MAHNIDGAILTDEVISSLKTLQENPDWFIEPVEKEINLWLTKYEYLNTEMKDMVEILSDLNFLKTILKGLSSTSTESNKRLKP